MGIPGVVEFPRILGTGTNFWISLNLERSIGGPLRSFYVPLRAIELLRILHSVLEQSLGDLFHRSDRRVPPLTSRPRVETRLPLRSRPSSRPVWNKIREIRRGPIPYRPSHGYAIRPAYHSPILL